MVLASMIAENTAGDLWIIPQEDAPPLMVLWDRGNEVFYLSGECQSQSSFDALADVVASEVRPQAVAARVSRIKAQALTPSLERRLPDLFPDTDLRESRTLFFVDDATRPLPVTPAIATDVALVDITPEILMPGRVAFSDLVLAEIRSMWPSEERFHEYGFGAVAVLDGEIICWCTSEYVSPTYCGIGIETSPRHEGRGVATATSLHVIREARRRGIAVCWECASTNRGSVRVAEKTGLVRVTEETYWMGSLE